MIRTTRKRSGQFACIQRAIRKKSWQVSVSDCRPTSEVPERCVSAALVEHLADDACRRPHIGRGRRRGTVLPGADQEVLERGVLWQDTFSVV